MSASCAALDRSAQIALQEAQELVSLARDGEWDDFNALLATGGCVRLVWRTPDTA